MFGIITRLSFLFITCLLAFTHIYAQNSQPDYQSFKDTSSKDIKKRLNAYYNLSQFYFERSISLSSDYAQRTLDLAVSVNDKILEGNALLNLGKCMSIIRKMDEAQKYYLQAFECFSAVNYTDGIAIACTEMGIMYESKYQFALALDYYFQALNIYSKMGNELSKAEVYIRISSLNGRLKNLTEAYDYYEKTLQIAKRTGDKSLLAGTYLLKGHLSIYSQQYHEALENYFKGLGIYKEINDPRQIANCYWDIGTYYLDMKEPKYALKYFIVAYQTNNDSTNYIFLSHLYTSIAFTYHLLGYSEQELEYNYNALYCRIKTGANILISSSNLNLGTTFFSRKQYDSAEFYFQEGLKYSSMENNTPILQRAYFKLYELYKAKNDFSKALSFFEISKKFEDSLESDEYDRRVSEKVHNYEIEKNKSEHRNNEIFIVALITGICILSILFIVLIIRNREKNTSNILLGEQAEKLEKTIDKLKETQVELNALNTELEARVEERSEDLKDEIERRKNVEQSLRQSEEKYRNIFLELQDTYFLLDTKGNIQNISPSCATTFGRTQDELIGTNFSSLLYRTSDIDFFLKKILAKGEITGFELRFKPVEDRDIYLSINAHCDYNFDSTPTQVEGILHDISERKRAEEIIENDRYLLRCLIDNMNAYVFIKDTESRFIVVNKTLSEVMQPESPDNIIGKTDFDFYPKELADSYYLEDKEILSTGKSFIDIEELGVDKNNEPIWILTTKVPFYNPDGNIAGIVGISTNINERKKSEEAIRKSAEELKELNATKDKFFSIIAHDLKNPMGNLKQLLNLVWSEFNNITSYELREYIDSLNQSAQRTYNLLENLLDWSGMQRGRFKYEPEDIDLYEIAFNTVYTLNSNATEKNIKLINEIQPDTFVLCDKEMIMTVVRNLTSNAIKFTIPGGSIVISAIINNENEHVEVTVTDNGIGISEENITQLFKIDANISTPGTADEKGTGLGLILCKEFIEKHGSRISVESQTGVGSSFKFILPKSKTII
ncbi:MAG: sensor signal transduction histidine kinase [Ignavibacteria bacterium]|nr:sensor signal transduction histidine kinase [Ignavibacteria bacterium]